MIKCLLSNLKISNAESILIAVYNAINCLPLKWSAEWSAAVLSHHFFLTDTKTFDSSIELSLNFKYFFQNCDLVHNHRISSKIAID